MKISPVFEQRALRIYAIARADKGGPRKYRAALSVNDRSLDVPIVEAGDGEHLVAVLPANSTKANSHVEVTERHTGNNAARIDMAKAEFLTKVSRHVPEEFSLLGLVDTVDLQNPLHRRQYDLNLDDCFDASDGDIVWRIAVDWRGSDKSKPRLELVGNDLKSLDVEIYEFEFQKGLLREGHSVNRVIATFRTPRHLTDFCLFARDPQREVTSNFYPMETPAAINLIAEMSSRDNSINEQQDTYVRWLEEKEQELENVEPRLVSSAKDALHIIIFAKDAPTSLIKQTLESLKSQLFGNWKATVLGANSLDAKDLDSRIDFVPLPSRNQVADVVNKVAKNSGAVRVCAVAAGDIFARGALAAIANASLDPLSVIVVDEDTRSEEGVPSRPWLKGPLNKQLAYTENWTGYGAFFPTSLVSNTALDGASSPSLIAYALALKAIEQHLPFVAIPQVLLHTTETSADATGNAGRFGPSETGAAKRMLSEHLHAVGANSIVEDGYLDGTLKISLADGSLPGKVSIVIPTMDHADMLERCVSSLLDKATYKDIEIVLVENNSREPETFELYDRLMREHPDIFKVVKWEGVFNYSSVINFGVTASSGDFLLLLNNDTEVIVPRFIEEMLALASIPEVGVVGAKLYFKDMLVQHAGMIIGPYGGISHANQNFPDTRPGYQNRALTQCSFSSVTGACQMARREVFDEVGGYDETFAVGFNDADFCLKVRAAGYDVVFTPYAELYHYEFVSRGREGIDSEKQARWEQERDAFFEKWHDELENGDPLVSPNLDKDNWYYALPDIQSA